MSSGGGGKSSTHLSGAVKSAILLLSLGYEQSAELLKLLSEEQVRLISEAIASLGEVTSEQSEDVLEEFLRLSGHGAGATRGGLGRAQRILAAAFGQEVAKKMAERLSRTPRHNLPGLSSLEAADPELLASLLGTEHPQTIALVLAHLAPGKSASVMQSLSEELRAEVAFRLASLDKTSPEVLGRVASVLEQKLKTVAGPSEAIGGVRVVAELLGRSDPVFTEEVLKRMEERDETVANQVRDLLFVFDDLSKVDVPGLKELLKQADRKLLTLAMKGTNADLQDHMFSTMSKRASEMLREDMEALGPVKVREVEDAQKQLLALARNLEKQGVLSLSASEADQYVV